MADETTMDWEDQGTHIIPIELEGGVSAFAEVAVARNYDSTVGTLRQRDGEAKFADAVTVIEAISKQLLKAIASAKPSQAEVEFGMEVAGEPGWLTAVLIKGSGKANMKIKLTWKESPPQNS